MKPAPTRGPEQAPEPGVGGRGRSPAGRDLLALRPVRWLVSWRGFPYTLQAATLLAFLALLGAGLGVKTPPGANAKLFAKSNLVTLAVWGLWWPLMIFGAVLLGRAWCAVCPLELVANLSERASRRLGLPKRRLRRFTLAGGFALALYGLIQLLVAGAHVHRVPAYTSLLLAGLLGLAALAGALFKDRAFCRAFCPIAPLLNAYGRGGMIAVRPGAAPVCDGCPEPPCFAASRRARLDARSCPTLLNPSRLASNRDCLLCTQCVKACDRGNMRLVLRRPFHAADEREPLATWPTTIFVALASGFVAWELIAEWPAAERIFTALPAWAARAVALPELSGLASGIWALALVPLALWTLAGVLARVLGEGAALGPIWRRLALPLAVIVSAGHMTKALAKLSSWAGFLPLALEDPSGRGTVARLAGGSVPSPAPLLPVHVVVGAGCVLIVSASLLSLREARLREGTLRRSLAAPLVAFATIFLAILFGWASSTT